MVAATIALVEELTELRHRERAARSLAQALGAEDLMIFVLDPEANALLPAPGLPQTLPNGRVWRDFVSQCGPEGVHKGRLPYPGRDEREALGLACPGGSVVVLLGGQPRLDDARETMPFVALVTATFRAEAAAIAQEGGAQQARAAARQAEALAAALATAQTDLKEALHRVRESDRRKDEFLAVLAHELRNPLAAVSNALQVLQAHPEGEAAQRAVEIATRQTRTLSRLVDDLLDVSRITLGKLELRREETDLRTVVERAVEVARRGVERAGQTLTVTLPASPVCVVGDPVRLEQVVTNLLVNARRYAGSGARVTVDLAVADGESVLRVSDTGAGIAPELLPRLFDAFTQADQSLGRSQGGLGIGLTLVRNLVTMHGGRVSAHSGGLGRGAEFVVHLSVLPPNEVAPSEPAVAQAVVGRRRVLVVDDSLDSAEMLAEILRLWGHEVCIAPDGEQALSESARFAPDVVLLDIGLPGLSGYAVAERIAGRADRRPWLVALTGYGQPSDVERARRAGFDMHLLKPVDIDRLKTAIAGRPAPA